MENFKNKNHNAISKKIVEKNFSRNNGFGQYEKKAIKLLEEIIAILKDFEINHCLISGTLLGYVRHNGFIPWDDDIDLLVDGTISEKIHDISKKHNNINIFYKDKEETIKFCYSNGNEILENSRVKYWKQYALKGKEYCWPFVDLFTYKSNDKSILFFQKKWDMNNFLPFKMVNFLGIKTFIPKNPNKFLLMNYGPNYMKKFKSSSFCHKTEERMDYVIEINSYELSDKKDLE
jgi:phosphorylcholine metabolism protein LicD